MFLVEIQEVVFLIKKDNKIEMIHQIVVLTMNLIQEIKLLLILKQVVKAVVVQIDEIKIKFNKLNHVMMIIQVQILVL